MINIQDIIPFMRKGWVAMDKDGVWVWFKHKPRLIDSVDEIWLNNERGGHFFGLSAFDIEPAENWEKSLIKVGVKR